MSAYRGPAVRIFCRRPVISRDKTERRLSRVLFRTLYRLLDIFPLRACRSINSSSRRILVFSPYSSTKLRRSFEGTGTIGTAGLGARQRAAMAATTAANIPIQRVGRKDAQKTRCVYLKSKLRSWKGVALRKTKVTVS